MFRYKHLFALAIAAGCPAAMAVAQPPDPEPPTRNQPALEPPALQEEPAPPTPPASQEPTTQEQQEEGVEYLSRGPLHEAFATPYETVTEAGQWVDQTPPEAIEELPPEYRPEGDNVTWIPGYWDWDSQENDYIWISGLWRDIPPGQSWIPGYWEQNEGRYRRVSGFWADQDVQEIAYLPAPPDSLEQGPSSPAPDNNHFYIPGYWRYQNTDYQWVPGYWAETQPGWVWTPVQYCWTPNGYVFTGGYWDYTLMNRGYLFTPVRYTQPLYTSPNYFYRPRYLVDTGETLLIHLFMGPRANRYYFGNYYDAVGGNYRPWISTFGNGNRYDPLYTYYSQPIANGRGGLLDWVADRNSYFLQNPDVRPARNVVSQQTFLRDQLQAAASGNNNPQGLSNDVLRAATIVDELEAVAQRGSRNARFQTLSQSQAQQIARQNREFEMKLSRQRQSLNPAVNDQAPGQRRHSLLKIPTDVDRSNANRGNWLSEEQLQRGKAATRRMRTNQEISDQALNNLAEQTTARNQYWEDMRRMGRIRPMATENWPSLAEERGRINRPPPEANVRFRPNLSSNKGTTAQQRLPEGNENGSATNIGSGNNSGRGSQIDPGNRGNRRGGGNQQGARNQQGGQGQGNAGGNRGGGNRGGGNAGGNRGGGKRGGGKKGG